MTCGLLSAIADEMMIVLQFISYFSTSWKSILYIESKGMASYISLYLFCSAHMVFAPGNIFHIWILLMTFFGLTNYIIIAINDAQPFVSFLVAEVVVDGQM